MHQLNMMSERNPPKCRNFEIWCYLMYLKYGKGACILTFSPKKNKMTFENQLLCAHFVTRSPQRMYWNISLLKPKNYTYSFTDCFFNGLVKRTKVKLFQSCPVRTSTTCLMYYRNPKIKFLGESCPCP